MPCRRHSGEPTVTEQQQMVVVSSAAVQALHVGQRVPLCRRLIAFWDVQDLAMQSTRHQAVSHRSADGSVTGTAPSASPSSSSIACRPDQNCHIGQETSQAVILTLILMIVRIEHHMCGL